MIVHWSPLDYYCNDLIIGFKIIPWWNPFNSIFFLWGERGKFESLRLHRFDILSFQWFSWNKRCFIVSFWKSAQACSFSLFNCSTYWTLFRGTIIGIVYRPIVQAVQRIYFVFRNHEPCQTHYHRYWFDPLIIIWSWSMILIRNVIVFGLKLWLLN